jgi:Diacylglycerol acyltransferase
MCNFASDSTGFSRGFPGVSPHLLTLTSNFTIPIYREILLLLGVCSVSKRSCERILRQGNGSAITIVVGGAAESLSAHPGTADLTLRKRCVVCLGVVQLYGVDCVAIPLDWGSSNLRFGKGMISHLYRAVACADVTLRSADLVPVFSFGENDVRSSLPLVLAYPYA